MTNGRLLFANIEVSADRQRGVCESSGLGGDRRQYTGIAYLLRTLRKMDYDSFKNMINQLNIHWIYL